MFYYLGLVQKGFENVPNYGTILQRGEGYILWIAWKTMQSISSIHAGDSSFRGEIPLYIDQSLLRDQDSFVL